MDTDSPNRNSLAHGALATGMVAGLLASTCCLGPLILILLGVSGAWIGNLAALEPYRPLFIGAAMLALCIAARRLWHPAACAPGQVCAAPRVSRAYKCAFFAVALLVVLALAFPLIAPWFY